MPEPAEAANKLNSIVFLVHDSRFQIEGTCHRVEFLSFTLVIAVQIIVKVPSSSEIVHRAKNYFHFYYLVGEAVFCQVLFLQFIGLVGELFLNRI